MSYRAKDHEDHSVANSNPAKSSEKLLKVMLASCGMPTWTGSYQSLPLEVYSIDDSYLKFLTKIDFWHLIAYTTDR
jgi:hypothetical protein